MRIIVKIILAPIWLILFLLKWLCLVATGLLSIFFRFGAVLPYLAGIDITKKQIGRRQDWFVIHAQLAVFYADRMPD